MTARVVDVSNPDSVAALADHAAALGKVTHIVHTAGLSPTQAPTSAILSVDLLGVALVLDAFAAVVAPGGAGVVIASMAGHTPIGLPPEVEQALAGAPTEELLSLPFLEPQAVDNPGIAYVMAKRANILRVQAASTAWGEKGARINSVSPGVISTPMGQQELAGENGAQMRAMVAMSATKRLGTPDDIAAAVEFLLSPQASFITGTDVLVDGGVTAAVRSASLAAPTPTAPDRQAERTAAGT